MSLSNLAGFAPETVWILIQKIWWFLIVLGILVAFHEFGHYLAARWAGVKVLRFSLGFGPKLFGRQIGETEYVVSAVPLGGYVKLFGEEETEAVTPSERLRSFVHQKLPTRVFIVAAGPGFNFLLAYLVFTIWLGLGVPLFVPSFSDLAPTVDAVSPGSPAEKAGLQPGDRILRINGKDTTTQAEMVAAVGESEGKPLTIDVRRNSTVKTFLVTPDSRTMETDGQEVTIYELGIEDPAPIVTAVLADSPAARAGFQEGDRVVSMNGQPISTWSQMTDIVRGHPGRPIPVQVRRDGTLQSFEVTPSKTKAVIDDTEIEIGKIGIMGPGRSLIRASTPLLAPLEGLRATWKWTSLTVVGIYKMITGELSSKNIGGPLMIASVSGEAAEQGLSSIAYLIAILSVNLGVLNLLPIPILDGGHLLFFGIEAVLRHPLEERQREFAQQVGLLLLVTIMVFAFWNDIERLLSS